MRGFATSSRSSNRFRSSSLVATSPSRAVSQFVCTPRCVLCFAIALSPSAGTYAQQASEIVRPAAVSTSEETAASADVATPSIGGVVREMPLDLWRCLPVDTAIVLGAGGAAAGVAHIWDDELAGQVENSVRLNDAKDGVPSRNRCS